MDKYLTLGYWCKANLSMARTVYSILLLNFLKSIVQNRILVEISEIKEKKCLDHVIYRKSQVRNFKLIEDIGGCT